MWGCALRPDLAAVTGMQAVWLEEGRLSLREVAAPRPPPEEAAVRVRLAGICNTDLELVRGYYPFSGVPGHEFVGVVEEGPRSLQGRRVVGEINATCGECAACRAGRLTHCERRTVLGIAGRHGAFAERLLLPAENLHPVPDPLADEQAVFTEPLAAALRIREQLPIGPGDRVLLVGAGKLGQLVARVLALAGCRLTVLARRSSARRALAGLAARVVGSADELPKGAFDLAVECTGNPEGFALARGGLRPGGTLVLKSTYAGRLEVDASSLVVDEITLVGSRCGPFPPALELLRTGQVRVEPLVEARYPLSRARDAFEHAARPGALKVLLEIG